MNPSFSESDAALLQLTLDSSLDIATICERAGLPPSSFFAWMTQPHIHEAMNNHIEFAQRQANVKVQAALARALPAAIECLSKRAPTPQSNPRIPNEPGANATGLENPPHANVPIINENFAAHLKALADHHDELEEQEMDRWLDADLDDDDDFDDEADITDTRADAILAALTTRYYATRGVFPARHLTTDSPEAPPASTTHFSADRHHRPADNHTTHTETHLTTDGSLTLADPPVHLTTDSSAAPPQLAPHLTTAAPPFSPTRSPSANSAASAFNSDSVPHLTTDDLTSPWLTQSQIASLLHLTKQDISHHARHILRTGELDPAHAFRIHLTTAADGKHYKTHHYSPAMILAIARRVKSPVATLSATHFRDWLAATHPEFLPPSGATP